MTLSDPRWLWALFALPLLLLAELAAARRAGRGIAALVGARPEHALLAQLDPRRRTLGAALRLAAFALLAIGAAGPEWGREVVRREVRGSDVVFLMDVSASMDTRDVAPSRLEEARREAIAVLDRAEGSRVAVIAFAGEAVRLCPLTVDRAAARLTLESLSSSSLSEPGTDLGRALKVAAQALPEGRQGEQAILLWTDGEDLERGALQALPALEHSGARVYAIGVGTPSGDVVPVLDDQGRAIDVKRDEHGAAVQSRLDEPLLRTIARRTRGAYFAASRPGGELPLLIAATGTVGHAAHGARLVERPVARFRQFAALAALLLALELVLPRRRPGRGHHAARATERGARAAAALALLLPLAWPGTARAQTAWARGDRAFRAGRFADAESLYARRLGSRGPDAVRVNRATAHALGGDRATAARELAQLAAGPGAAGAMAGYNAGTLEGEARDFDTALRELRGAIERDPKDADARWNYEYLLRQRASPHPPPPRRSSGGGGGGAQAPQPSAPPSSPGPGAAAPEPAPPQIPPPHGGSMTRAQAERLLDALADQERLDRQAQARARTARPRNRRDW